MNREITAGELLTGDVETTTGSTDVRVVGLYGTPVTATLPTQGDFLRYDQASGWSGSVLPPATEGSPGVVQPDNVTTVVDSTGKLQAVKETVGEVALAPTQAGAFTVAHGLASLPRVVVVEMTSDGQVWFQTPRYDATYLYLVASAPGITGYARIWL